MAYRARWRSRSDRIDAGALPALSRHQRGLGVNVKSLHERSSALAVRRTTDRGPRRKAVAPGHRGHRVGACPGAPDWRGPAARKLRRESACAARFCCRRARRGGPDSGPGALSPAIETGGIGDRFHREAPVCRQRSRARPKRTGCPWRGGIVHTTTGGAPNRGITHRGPGAQRPGTAGDGRLSGSYTGLLPSSRGHARTGSRPDRA